MQRALIFLLLCGCRVALAPQNDTQITCASTADCPDTWSCVSQRCRHPEDQAEKPQLTVAFSSPENGAQNVAVSGEVILAFSADIDRTTLVASLTANGISLVPEVRETAFSNTVRISFEHLNERTEYTLVIDAGVLAANPDVVDPLVAPFSLTFTTGLEPDLIAPQPVRQVLVDWSDDSGATLTWAPPADDFAGVLILRRKGGPVTATPRDRTTYAIGAFIGDAEVIASTSLAVWQDVTREAGAYYDYALFAFDAESNHSVVARAPFIAADAQRWCPNEAGELSASATGAVSVAVSSPAGAPLFEVPLVDGTAVVTAAAPFTLGTEYSLRTIARDAAGNESRARRTPFWTSHGTLAVGAALNVGVPATALLSFTREGWQTIAVEIDTNPSPGIETYVPAATVAASSATQLIATAGSYRWRARPLQSGCATEAAWTTSNEFKAGSAWYVAPDGSDDDVANTAQGKSALAPFATLTKALARTTGADDTDIYVAAGSYAEQIVLKPRTRLLGSYVNNFEHREAAARSSILAPAFTAASIRIAGAVEPSTALPIDLYYAARAFDSSIDRRTEIEGFTLAPTTTGVLGPSGSTCVVCVSGCSMTLRNVSLSAAAAPSTYSTGVMIDSPSTLLDNVDVNATYGVLGLGAIEVHGSRFTMATSAQGQGGIILFNGASPTIIEDSSFVPGPGGAATSLGIGLVSPGAQVRIVRNTISGGAGGNAAAVQIYNGSNSLVASNVIYGGQSTNSIGVHCGNGTLIATNNTIGVAGIYAMQSTTCRITAVNNLLFGAVSWLGYNVAASASLPRTFENNGFLADPAPLLYVSAASPSNGTWDSVASLQPGLCTEGIRATGNLQVAGSLASVLVSPGGTDGVMDTLLDNDWRLQPSQTELRTGGRATVMPSCGGVVDAACLVTTPGTESCGGTDFDVTGTQRTLPYSIGAYELD